MSAGRQLHLVLAKFLWIKAFQPLLEPGIIAGLGREIDRLGVVDDGLLDQDRRPRPKRQGDRITRPGIDGNPLSLAR